MKIKELIEFLKKLDPEMIVYTSAEYEGPLERDQLTVSFPIGADNSDKEVLVIAA